MVLSVTNIGGNPQQPMVVADAFIPDQLIAGQMQLITDNQATLTGSAALQRGTVLGRVNDASPTSSTGKAFAAGTIAIGAPVAGDTVTIGGTALTFANGPGTYQED